MFQVNIYLGVTLDKIISFKQHIEGAIQKTRLVVRLLFPLLKKNSLVSQDMKLLPRFHQTSHDLCMSGLCELPSILFQKISSPVK